MAKRIDHIKKLTKVKLLEFSVVDGMLSNYEAILVKKDCKDYVVSFISDKVESHFVLEERCGRDSRRHFFGIAHEIKEADVRLYDAAKKYAEALVKAHYAEIFIENTRHDTSTNFPFSNV